MFKGKFFTAAFGAWLGIAGGSGRCQETPNVAAASPPAAREPGRLNVSPGLAEAAPATSRNQRMADAIAQHLQQSGRLRGYRVGIKVIDGTVEVSGQVADAGQRAEVVQQVRAVPGVEKVNDLLEIPAAGVVQAVQDASGMGHAPDVGSMGHGPFLPAWRQRHLTTDIPQEPMSIMEGNVPPPVTPGMQPPPLPPNAWPTYAPYNNYSRVGYPTLYPYQAFPFIGPMYPFPKVPLGWRSVTLTWQDGYWWYGKHATGHDWWRIRYY